jgi:2-polyprenyl-3-methyl-5-hydroxy-6-metoxy-1,4-benzoquinol methylase
MSWRPELARCMDCGTAVTLPSEPGPAPPGTASPSGEASPPDPTSSTETALPSGEACRRSETSGPDEAASAPRGARLAAPVLVAFDRRRVRMLRRAVLPPARLLDAGAGRGRFVASARAAGYDAGGFEPDPARAAAAAGYGVRLRVAGVEDADVEAGSVDAVTAWHVLEHVPDPDAAVASFAAWLRPGGALLVGVPNLGSLQARLGGERWHHLDLPRHRTHFTVAGLHALLRRHGLEPVRTHHVLAEHNSFGMWQSLVNRVTRRPSHLFALLKREAPLDARDLATSVLLLPLFPFAALLELAAGLARHGGTVAVLARKRDVLT